MARYSGLVGFSDEMQEVRPGVWEDVITERKYVGDVVKATRYSREQPESVNNAISVQNSISILADGYANEHTSAIRYVKWAGALWTVTAVEVERPRLLLRLGEVYHGPTPAVA